MRNRSRTLSAVLLAVAVQMSTAAAAQLPPGAIKGNPTPGVEQPAPPVLADRIAVTGCVARVGAPPSDPNSYSEERFTLTNAKKGEKALADQSAAASAPIAAQYRLAAIDTLLAPFVGKRVELSGEIIKPTTGTGPTLRVEFVQKTAATCQ